MLLFSNIKHIIPASICRPPYSLKHKKQAHISTDTTKIQIKFEKRAPFSILFGQQQYERHVPPGALYVRRYVQVELRAMVELSHRWPAVLFCRTMPESLITTS